MSRPRWTTGFLAVAVGLGFLVPSGLGAAGPLRISNLVVSNTDNALSVNMVLLASLPDGVVEGIEVRGGVHPVLKGVRTFYVDDPDGNECECITQDPGKPDATKTG